MLEQDTPERHQELESCEVEAAARELTKIGDQPAFEAKLRELAELKLPDLNANDIEGAMLILAGTARSMGIEITD